MRSGRVVETKRGETTYRGILAERGASFLGVRYAEPPLGPLRFKPSVRSAAPRHVDATRPGLAPAQVQRKGPDWLPRQPGFAAGEDCLNLNIFTPAPDKKRRPVIVHVFGGGFQGGSATGTYQDDLGFAARGDVVLVRPNMRVGALGFLHLGPAMGAAFAATNRGLLDLVAALKWVCENIQAFGGDPENVTLIGMSSGAFTIAALFGMDGVAHLFRRAWLMSGSASRVIAAETASVMAAELLDRCGIAAGDAGALEALPVEMILKAQEAIAATHLGERNAPGGRTLGIVRDAATLVRHPLEGLASGDFRDHQLVMGWSRDEARMWYVSGVMPDVRTRETLIASIARFLPGEAEAVLAGLEAEFPGKGLSQYEEVFLSRAVYREPALRTAHTHTAAGGSCFAYEFAWVPPFEGGRLGAAHGFDEPFVFGDVSPDRVPIASDSPGAPALAQAMSDALFSFARCGAPGWPSFASDGFIRRWG